VVSAGTSQQLDAESVWQALAEIPDPEIPVISIVELGVIKDVRIDGPRVEVEFTPTFMGCPALEAMQAAIHDKIEALGGTPVVHVVLDDSWSTGRITPAGRAKLEAAGFAPPAPRRTRPPTLLQLQQGPFRCPWCGSTKTRLENLFGPTPCRSLRYCTACRQPLEQFKTI
jgi:ring-1,2-phenylacetyl-CoA epoxidase subunit PaaD